MRGETRLIRGGLWVVLLSAWAVCWPGRVEAQQWQTFTAADGLAGSFPVYAISQSADGAMWFATSGGGVSRYDGTWQTFNSGNTPAEGLSSNEVWAVHKSADGAMWFGTWDGGVNRYDGTWQHFSVESTGGGLADNGAKVIYQSMDGAMWFATFGGVSRYDGTWQTFNVESTGGGLVYDNVATIYQAADGAMWFGTFGGGVSRYNGTWQTFTKTSTGQGLLADEVNAITQTADGAMWFGTTRGLSRYDGSWQTFRFYEDGCVGDIDGDDSFCSDENQVDAIFRTADGALWVANSGGDLRRYDGDWQVFTQESTGGVLLGESVISIFQSVDGAMWFGTYSSVIRYDDTWQTFNTENTAGGMTESYLSAMIQSADGALLFLGYGGLTRYDGKWETFPLKPVSDSLNYFATIYQSRDGALWGGTSGGVTRYDGRWQNFTVESTEGGLGDNYVNAIYQSADGAMWFGTSEGGVSRYDGTRWERFTVVSTAESIGGGLADDGVEAIYQSADGAMWFGTWGGGVSRYDGTWQTFNYDNTGDTGLYSNNVQAIYQSADGAMWFGTYDRGVNRYDGEWQIFAAGISGLHSNNVQAIYQSTDGAMWFGTDGGGVSRYDGQWLTFIEGNPGLSSNDVTGITQSADGAMWFATSAGATRFKMPQVPLSNAHIRRAPPPLLGDDTFLFICEGGEIAYPEPPLLSFALTQSRELPAPESSEWTEFGPETRFEETALSNGEWSFHVRSMDHYGHIDPTPATSTFTVDLTGPSVLLAAPSGIVHDQVAVVGTVLDNSAVPDLDSYTLEIAPGTPSSRIPDIAWSVIKLHSSLVSADTIYGSFHEYFGITPVTDDTLALWDTAGLHGPYMLRLRADDRLNHQSQHTIGVTVVSAAEVVGVQGGHIRDQANRVDLYIPPGGFGRNLQQNPTLSIAPVETGTLALPTDRQFRYLGVAYSLQPDTLALQKPALFSLAVEDSLLAQVGDPGKLALFAWADTGWVRLGGTLKSGQGEGADTLKVALGRLGTLALMEDASSQEGRLSIAGLDCQPRAFGAGTSFGEETTILFSLGKQVPVTVKVYDLQGRLQRQVVGDQEMQSGSNAVVWDGRDHEGRMVHSGMYVVAVEAEGKVETKTVGVMNKSQ